MPTEDPIRALVSIAYWLLFHEVARDMFHETPVHQLTVVQDRAVTSRVARMAAMDVLGGLARGAAPASQEDRPAE